jgi:DNA-binding response OmpR family regulator
MKHDDVVLLESLLTAVVDALKPVRGALRDAEVALEIVRRRKAEHGERSGVVLPDLIDDSRFTVRWKGAECTLGPTVVFRLFRRLARPANHYVSVELLLEDVWGDQRTEGTTVRSAVRNLRRKLEAAGMAELAEAIQGPPGHYCLMLDGVAPKE